MSTREWSAYLTEVIDVPGRPRDVAAEVIDRMASRYRQRLPLLPGAVEVVHRLASHWPLGLASSSPRQLIDAVLESANLASKFRVTVSTEEVRAGKPSPAVYAEVVRQLGVDAQQAVAIEDSSNGLRSAARAGLHVIAVPTKTFPPDKDALSLASVVVHSLDDITPPLVTSLTDRS
jgi:HAD superfamily hydrolase (TIGR01509 family)